MQVDTEGQVEEDGEHTNDVPTPDPRVSLDNLAVAGGEGAASHDPRMQQTDPAGTWEEWQYTCWDLFIANATASFPFNF